MTPMLNPHSPEDLRAAYPEFKTFDYSFEIERVVRDETIKHYGVLRTSDDPEAYVYDEIEQYLLKFPQFNPDFSWEYDLVNRSRLESNHNAGCIDIACDPTHNISVIAAMYEAPSGFDDQEPVGDIVAKRIDDLRVAWFDYDPIMKLVDDEVHTERVAYALASLFAYDLRPTPSAENTAIE